MTKNEQNRVVGWRLKIIRQATELPRGVAQICRHFGLSRKTYYKGEPGTKAMVTPACAIGLERLFTFLAQHPVMWSPRSCICGSVTDLDRPGSTAISTAFIT
jgi:hypothetical protein